MGERRGQIATLFKASVLMAVFVCAGAGCGGKGVSHGSPSSAQTTSAQISSASDVGQPRYDMQSVEGCFNAGGENTHEAPDYGWFDLVDLGNEATNQGQGAFSTFSGSAFDDAAYYFFSSHDQAVAVSTKADLNAHGATVHVVGNVIVALYEDLHPSQLALENRCLTQ
jgi:hypothetical protein